MCVCVCVCVHKLKPVLEKEVYSILLDFKIQNWLPKLGFKKQILC